MRKHWFVIASILVVVSISIPVSLILIQDTPLPDKSINLPDPPNVYWQIDLDNFVSDIVSDEKRVYTVDGVNAICLNKTTGKQIWISDNVGYSTSVSQLVLCDDKIFVGTYGGAVTSFNKYTGQKLLRFQAPVTTTWGGKSTPQDFFIEDGRLYVFQNGYAVFNATTGESFFETNGWTVELGNASVTASETDFIFIDGYRRVNPDNGEIIWNMDGRFDGYISVSQDKILIWNYNPSNFSELGHFIRCINPHNLDTFWSFDVTSPIYHPIIHNNLVLFGAYDGYFYALDLYDGNLVWKTLVTNQNNQTKIIGNEGINYPLTPVVSPIQINTEKEIGVWSFAFIQNGWGGVIEYVGNICGINITNGDLLWKKDIDNNASITGGGPLRPTSIGLVLLNDNAFLTIGSDFYTFNSQRGIVFEEKNYDHHLLEPNATDDLVFVAEELHFFAYE